MLAWIRALLLIVALPAFSAAQGTVQWTLDRDATLVSKDVGDERWAITYRLSDSRVTGNVFRTGGGPSSFLQCNRTGNTPTNLVFDCFGANACSGAPCPTSQYTLIASGVELAPSFFFPPGDVPPLTMEFVPGQYAKLDTGQTCTLITSPFAGRTEVVLNCVDGDESTATLTVYTGPIIGNPFEAALVDAGLDQIPGGEEFAWGLVTAEAGGSLAGCFDEGELISARQVGDTLNLSRYFFGDGSFDCGLTLVRQTP